MNARHCLGASYTLDMRQVKSCVASVAPLRTTVAELIYSILEVGLD